MKKTLCALVALAALAFVSLSFDSSCANPAQLCRGTSINRRFSDPPANTVHVADCTRCVEATCCDKIGDCQTTDCANQVASVHACVIDAGRSAASFEPTCRDQLKDDQSRDVYQCMRDKCDHECALPTCRLEPLIPPLGDQKCDQCFARGCCSLMNECAKNRTCLLALSCIVAECRPEFGEELGIAGLAEATSRKDFICDGGVPPIGDGPGDGGPGGGPGDGRPGDGSCFRRCIEKSFVPNDRESFEASCLAAQINECGAAVDCGKSCIVPRDASADSSPAPADAGVDAPADGPSDAPAD